MYTLEEPWSKASIFILLLAVKSLYTLSLDIIIYILVSAFLNNRPRFLTDILRHFSHQSDTFWKINDFSRKKLFAFFIFFYRFDFMTFLVFCAISFR